jgi:hypothetical protein
VENLKKLSYVLLRNTVFQVLQKHAGCLDYGIQEEGMRALGSMSESIPTKKLLGYSCCMEFILAGMKKYPDPEKVQEFGCFVISQLVLTV